MARDPEYVSTVSLKQVTLYFPSAWVNSSVGVVLKLGDLTAKPPVATNRSRRLELSGSTKID